MLQSSCNDDAGDGCVVIMERDRTVSNGMVSKSSINSNELYCHT